jgi:hypothetical protein
MDLGATSISLNSPHVCIVDLLLGQPHDLQCGPRRIDVGMPENALGRPDVLVAQHLFNDDQVLARLCQPRAQRVT